MKYILIFIVYWGDAPHTSTIEFNSEVACIHAGNELLKKAAPSHRVKPVLICVPKGRI